MTNRFDWITEDEGEWEDHDEPETLIVPSVNRRTAVTLAFIMFVLVGGGMLVYRQVVHQVDGATTAVSNDIRASYQLFYRAVQEGDVELFNSVISGRSLPWTEAQQLLFKKGLLLERWPFDLQWQPGDFKVVDVQLSPDFREAEMKIEHVYEGAPQDVLAQNELNEIVTLQQTAVFRQGRNRWIYAPPLAEFWGAWQTVDGEHFQSVFPTRDEAVVRRLLSDLETNLLQACQQGVVDCLQLPNMLLRFDTSAGSLSEMNQLLDKTADVIVVPTPSVVGLPVDETSYQWLRRGYAAQLISVVMTRQIGWDCCDSGLFLQAIIDKQLSELGLRAWPLNDEEYGRVFEKRVVGLSDLGAYWQMPPMVQRSDAEWQEVYALVDFIFTKDDAATPKSVMTQLVSAGSYSDWLSVYMSVNGGRFRRQQREWLRFVGGNRPFERPIPLPEQDVQLMCKPFFDDSAYLYRYPIVDFDLDDAAWTVESENRRFLFMAPLLNDNAVLLQERQYRLDQTSLLIWQSGKEIEITSEPFSSALFRVDEVDPGLLLYGYQFSTQKVSFSLLDQNSCNDDGCDLFDLGGLPVWSPDGQQTIVADPAGRLWLGDEHGQVKTAVSTGAAPFWIDNSRFGYIHLVGSLARPPAEVVISSVSTPDEAEIALALPDLAAYLPRDISLDQLIIRGTATHPSHPNQLFLAATYHRNLESGQEGSFIFQLDTKTGELKLPLTLPYNLGLYNPFVFSPDGRWLTIQSFAESKTERQLHLLEVSTGNAVAFHSGFLLLLPGYDWSADGEWLLRIDNGFVQLIAPAYDYQEVVVHDNAVCNFATWINTS